MGFSALRMPIGHKSATFGSVATDGSSGYIPVFVAPAAGEIISAYFVNGTTSSATSGTTTGSSASVVTYKNASGTASVIGTFNGSGTNVATLGSASLITSSTANARLAAGDIVLAEFLGGAANNGSQAGSFVQVNFTYSRDAVSAASAGTGPA